MAKTMLTILACVGAGSALSGCATAQRTEMAAAGGMKGTVKVAYTGAAMVRTTVGEAYNGLGGAVRSPFRDFNLMQEKIPVALSKAKGDAYDVSGLDSCDAVAAAIQELDVVLGPDVDTPKVEDQRTRSQRLASAAADGAVNAARGALDHYIPVRGVVRQITGARKYEKEVTRANLAGSIRRGFLKAIGMQQNCAWPAAPISFKPRPTLPSVQLAANTVTAPAPTTGGQVLKVANVTSAPTAAAPVALASASSAPVVATPAVAPALSVVAVKPPAPASSAAPASAVVAAAKVPAPVAVAAPSLPAAAAAAAAAPIVVATARTVEAPPAVAKPVQIASVAAAPVAAAPSAPIPSSPVTPAASPAQVSTQGGEITLVADHGPETSSSAVLGLAGRGTQVSTGPGLR